MTQGKGHKAKWCLLNIQQYFGLKIYQNLAKWFERVMQVMVQGHTIPKE